MTQICQENAKAHSPELADSDTWQEHAKAQEKEGEAAQPAEVAEDLREKEEQQKHKERECSGKDSSIR